MQEWSRGRCKWQNRVSGRPIRLLSQPSTTAPCRRRLKASNIQQTSLQLSLFLHFASLSFYKPVHKILLNNRRKHFQRCLFVSPFDANFFSLLFTFACHHRFQLDMAKSFAKRQAGQCRLNAAVGQHPHPSPGVGCRGQRACMAVEQRWT